MLQCRRERCRTREADFSQRLCGRFAEGQGRGEKKEREEPAETECFSGFGRSINLLGRLQIFGWFVGNGLDRSVRSDRKYDISGSSAPFGAILYAARSQRCGWVKTHPYITTRKRDFSTSCGTHSCVPRGLPVKSLCRDGCNGRHICRPYKPPHYIHYGIWSRAGRAPPLPRNDFLLPRRAG